MPALTVENKADDLQPVEVMFGYRFVNSALLQEAVRLAGASRAGEHGNKRLAIVGDKVLGLALSEPWYKSIHSSE